MPGEPTKSDELPHLDHPPGSEKGEDGYKPKGEIKDAYKEKREHAKELLEKIIEKFKDVDPLPVKIQNILRDVDNHFEDLPDTIFDKRKFTRKLVESLEKAERKIEILIQRMVKILESEADEKLIPVKEGEPIKKLDTKEDMPDEDFQKYKKLREDAEELSEKLKAHKIMREDEWNHELEERKKRGEKVENESNKELLDIERILDQLDKHFSRFPKENIGAQDTVQELKKGLDRTREWLKKLNARMVTLMWNDSNVKMSAEHMVYGGVELGRAQQMIADAERGKLEDQARVEKRGKKRMDTPADLPVVLESTPVPVTPEPAPILPPEPTPPVGAPSMPEPSLIPPPVEVLPPLALEPTLPTPPKSSRRFKFPKSKVEVLSEEGSISPPPDVPLVEPHLPPGETPEPTSEKKENKKIIDIPGSIFAEVLGANRKKIKQVEKMLVRSESVDEAQILIDGFFTHADERNLSEHLSKYGYEVADFLKQWKEKWSGEFFRALQTDIDYERVKVMEETRGWTGGIIDWTKSNFNKDRLKQVALRAGTVAVVGTGLGLGLSAAGAGAVGAIATGGAVGFTRFAQSGFKKSKEYLNKSDAAAAETTQKKVEEIRNERLTSEKVTKKLIEKLDKRSSENIFGLLSGVVREGSFEISDTETEMKFANQALLQAKYVEHITREMQEKKAQALENGIEESALAAESKEIQERRLDHLLMSLYADDSERFTQALVAALEHQPGLVKVLEKINAFKNANLEQLIQKTKEKETAKNEKERKWALNVLNGLFHTAGGAAIVMAIQAEPGFARAMVMGITGGYLGAKAGMAVDREVKKEKFEEQIMNTIWEAEHALQNVESGSVSVERPKEKKKWYQVGKKEKEGEPLTPEQKKAQYQKWAEQLRTALNFGTLEQVEMVDGEQKKTRTMLWYRAHAVLRELEKNLYELPAEAENARMDSLLDALSSDLEKQTAAQKEKLKEIQKTSKLRTVAYALGGMAAGALGGYGLSMLRAHDAPTSEKISPAHTQAAGLHTRGEELVAQKHPEFSTKVAAGAVVGGVTPDTIRSGGVSETLETKPFSVEPEIIQKGEGVLHAVHRLENQVEALKNMTPPMRHKWEIDELKKLGFKFEDGKWGYPFTVHKGAEIGVYVGEDGKPHLAVIGEEGKDYTMHKNIMWKDTSATHAPEVPEKDIKVAVGNAKEFTDRMHQIMDPNDPNFKPVAVSKELTQALKETYYHDRPIPGMKDITPMPQTGTVRITLEDGNTIDAYPQQVVDFTPNALEKNYWRLDLPEHSPIVPLPGESGPSVGKGFVDSDTAVHKADLKSVMTREEYDKLVGQHPTARAAEGAEAVAKQPKSPQAEQKVEKPALVENKKSTPEVERVPEINAVVERTYKVIETNLGKLKSSIAAPDAAVKEYLRSLKELKDGIATNKFVGMSEKQFSLEEVGKRFNTVDARLLLSGEFQYPGVNLGGLEGDVSIGTDYVNGKISESYLLFRTGDQQSEYLFKAPDGYEFVTQGNQVMLQDGGGIVRPLDMKNQDNLPESFIKVSKDSKAAQQ